MHRTCYLYVLTLGFVGCSSAGDPQAGDGDFRELPPAVEVVDAGHGDGSRLPLWPLGRGSSSDQLRVLNEREVGGRRVIAVMTEGEAKAVNWQWYGYYSESDAGLLFHGGSRYGLLERPVLVVPAQVRDGMVWTSDPGRGGASGGGRPLRCTARKSFPNVAQTFLTAATVWNIDCRDGYRFAWAQTLAEGVGPLPGRRLDLREAPFELEPSVDETPLEPLHGGEPLFVDLFPHRIGALALPEDLGDLRIVDDGEQARLSLGGVVDLDGGGMAVSDYLPSRSRRCFRLRGDEFDLAEDLECPDPLGAAIGGDGKLRSIPVGEFCIEGGETCSEYRFLAIRGDERGAEVLVGKDQLYSARYYDGKDEYPEFRIDEPETLGHKLGGLGLVDPTGAYSLLFGERGSKTESLVVPDYLGSELYAGKWDGRWHDPHPAFVPTALSAFVTRTKRDLLDVTPDGRIARVSVESGELRLSLLAHVALPAGHVAVGAIDRGDDLVVFTLKGYLGFDAQIVLDPSGSAQHDQTIPPEMGKTFAWRARPRTPPAAPTLPPPELTPVYLQGETRDARVCSREPWADTTGELTVAGLPTSKAEVVSTHCALLFRDLAAAGLPLDAMGRAPFEALAVTGDMPGTGRARLGRRVTEPDGTWPRLESSGELAPLSGGGFVNGTSPFWRWGPGAVLEGSVNGAEGGKALPDAAGNGLWMLLPDTTACAASSGCAQWALWGAGQRAVFTIQDPAPPEAAPPTPSTSGVIGGGVVTGRYLLRPDGVPRFYSLPDAPLGARFTPGGALADDTVCGLFEENVVEAGMSKTRQVTLCITPDGSTRTSPTAVWPPYHSASGVFYALDSANQTLRFDPDAMTIAPVDFTGIPGVSSAGPAQPPVFVHDAAGELFGTVPGAPNTSNTLPVLLHFGPQELEAIPLPTPPDQNFGAHRLLVDESAFLFVGPPGSATGVLRVGR